MDTWLAESLAYILYVVLYAQWYVEEPSTPPEINIIKEFPRELTSLRRRGSIEKAGPFIQAAHHELAVPVPPIAICRH